MLGTLDLFDFQHGPAVSDDAKDLLYGLGTELPLHLSCVYGTIGSTGVPLSFRHTRWP